MTKPEFNEKIFYVHNSDVRARGVELGFSDMEVISELSDADSTIAMLQDERVTSRLEKGANLLVFKPAPKIEFLAKEHEWNLIAPSAEINRRFENKFTIANEFLAAELPVLEYVVVELGKVSWSEIETQFGDIIIAQTERGFSGVGTYKISSEVELKSLVDELGDRLVKFASFVEGETYTLNACVTRHGTLVSRPFLQLADIDGWLGSTGNSHVSVDDDLAFKIMGYAEKFGAHMYREGFRGFFGLDVIVSDGEVKGFIECNARLTASSNVFTEMQVASNQTPFVLLHVLEHLNQDYKLDILEEQRKLADGFNESHITLPNITDSSSRVPTSLKPGIYSEEGEWLRDGIYWRDLEDSEVLLRLRSKEVEIKSKHLFGVLVSRTSITKQTRDMFLDLLSNKSQVFRSKDL